MKMELACFEKKKKKSAYVRLYGQEWKVKFSSENRSVTVSRQDIPNSPFQFLQEQLYLDGLGRYLQHEGAQRLGRRAGSGGRAPQDGFGFL